MTIVSVSEVIGQLCWKAEVGVGSFLTLQIGDPYIWVHERCSLIACPRAGYPHRCVDILGTWTLWVYQCVWEIRKGSIEICSSKMPREKIASGVNELIGSEVDGIHWDASALEWVVRLEFGFELRMRPYPGRETESQLKFAILFGYDRSSIALINDGLAIYEEATNAD